MIREWKFPGGRAGVGLWLLLWVLTLPAGAAASDARGGAAWGTVDVLGLGSIRNITYSPDGTRLAVASSLGLVIWDEAAVTKERSMGYEIETTLKEPHDISSPTRRRRGRAANEQVLRSSTAWVDE